MSNGLPPPMCQISIGLDNFRRYFAGDEMKLPVPNGAPCEVCGKRSIWILKRRIHGRGGYLGSGSTHDPDSPCHPRCADHLAPGDAWTIDGLKMPGVRR